LYDYNALDFHGSNFFSGTKEKNTLTLNALDVTKLPPVSVNPIVAGGSYMFSEILYRNSQTLQLKFPIAPSNILTIDQ
jgi:hypothetical protein